MRSFKNGIIPGIIFFLLTTFTFADPSTERLQADYTKIALPIFQHKCFACHGPNPLKLTDVRDLKQKKKMAKAIKMAKTTFPLGDIFPFPDSDDTQEDLTLLKKTLQNDEMPPKKLRPLKMVELLSAEEKKALMEWIERARKDVK